MSFLDKVDKALIDSGITSNPLIEEFMDTISEAIRPEQVSQLEQLVASNDQKEVDKLSQNLLTGTSPDENKRYSDAMEDWKASGSPRGEEPTIKPHLFTLADMAFSKDDSGKMDLDEVILVSNAIAKTFSANFKSKKLIRIRENVAGNHVSALDNLVDEIMNPEDEETGASDEDEDFIKSTLGFFNTISEKSTNSGTVRLADDFIAGIEEYYNDDPESGEEDLLGDEPEEEDKDLTAIDWENAQVTRQPPGDEKVNRPGEKEPARPEDIRPFYGPEDVADSMEDDGDDEETKAWLDKLEDEHDSSTDDETRAWLDDSEDKPRKKVSSMDPSTGYQKGEDPEALIEVPPEWQKSWKHHLEMVLDDLDESGISDAKIKRLHGSLAGYIKTYYDAFARGKKQEEAGKTTNDKVQILKTSGDEALIRVKAVKKDKKTGKGVYTYRFATVNTADVGRLTPDNIWEWLKDKSREAKEDPTKVKAYNQLFTVNLKDAYNGSAKPAASFEEHLDNFVGTSPSNMLMKAYVRNDPYDRYRLSGTIASIKDRVAAKMMNDLYPRMVKTNIAKWLLSMKRDFEGKGIDEDIKISSEKDLLVVLEALGEVNPKLSKLAVNAIAYNTVAKAIMKDPAMLEKYGIEAPDYAKGRDESFKKWYKQETGPGGNIGWADEKKQSDERLGATTSGRASPENRAQYEVMFGKKLAPYERGIQKSLVHNFSKVVKDPETAKSFFRWLDNANVGLTEASVIQELADAAKNGKLPEYLHTYSGEYDIIERISRLVQQFVQNV